MPLQPKPELCGGLCYNCLAGMVNYVRDTGHHTLILEGSCLVSGGRIRWHTLRNSWRCQGPTGSNCRCNRHVAKNAEQELVHTKWPASRRDKQQSTTRLSEASCLFPFVHPIHKYIHNDSSDVHNTYRHRLMPNATARNNHVPQATFGATVDYRKLALKLDVLRGQAGEARDDEASSIASSAPTQGLMCE
jgi:hypothetical protein